MGGHKQISIADAFAALMAAFDAGRKTEARKRAQELTKSAPKFSGGHYVLGLLALDADHPRQAVRHLAEAAALSPEQSVLHLALARALEATGQNSEAALHYRTVLELMPNHAHAHACLGRLAAAQGRTDEAEAHCRAAVAADPAHAEAWNVLGLQHLIRGDAAAAAAAFGAALQQRPSWPQALNNMGLALTRTGRLVDALAVLSGAVDLRPDHAGSRVNLAAALRLSGRLDEAAKHAEAAAKAAPRSSAAWLELGLIRRALGHPDGAAAALERAAAAPDGNAEAWFCLGEIRRDLGDVERAAAAFQRCLETDPSDALGAGLHLALLNRTETPQCAPPAYVGRLFDEYADRFETSLVEKLGYRGPEILSRSLGPLLTGKTDLSILDVGCGTGLAGPMLRPHAGRLVGLDLSARMLDKARGKELYDVLHQDEAVHYLDNCTEKFDVIAAADVLIYLGDLAPFLSAAAECLKTPGGLVAFTLEKTADGSDIRLGEKLRYAHSAEYVRRIAGQSGLREVHLDEQAIRNESGNPVDGLAVVLIKP